MSAILRHNLNAFWLAIGFLTRIPTPHIEKGYEIASRNSILYYPLAGLIIGGISCLPILLLPTDNHFITAIITVMLWAMITGGLHLDGLADSADAWLGSQGNAKRALSIMKDPAVGPAGAIIIVFVLLLKVATIAALLGVFHYSDVVLTVIFSAIVARTLMILLFLTTPYVRDKGLASSLVDLATYPAWIIVSTVLAVIFMLGYFVPIVISILSFFALRWLKMKIIAGFTGDTAGGVLEVSETVFLLVVSIQVT